MSSRDPFNVGWRDYAQYATGGYNNPQDDPDPPEAECRKCKAVWDSGEFYENWLQGLPDDHPIVMPDGCPMCEPDHYEEDRQRYLDGRTH